MKTWKYLWLLLIVALLVPLNVSAKKKTEKVKSDRELWAGILYQMAAPVLSNMSEGKLQENMLVELSPTWDGRDKRVTYMECFGRLMAGLAPWLSLPDDDTAEGIQRKQLREWALKSYAQSVDPESKDYLLWRKEGQPLVDAAYIAESFLRGYDVLWVPLDDLTKQRYIAEFQQLRRVDPPYTNWLLFSSTVECFLKKAGAQTDYYRITSALRKVDEWYVGDGWYSLPAGQVRAAMTAVIQRMFGDNRNFNAEGYLTLGFNGSQPNISDWYTNNGSLYLASLAFLPLGLPADAPFWTDAPQLWTSKKAWGGEDFPKDHAY